MEISKACYMKLYDVWKFNKGGERHQEKLHKLQGQWQKILSFNHSTDRGKPILAMLCSRKELEMAKLL